MAIEPVTREERFLAAAGGRSVTTPEPITRKEQLLQGIIDAVKSGGATPDVIEGAVNDYLNANPVQPGATTEQAAQIEQNKTDIADLQAEIENKQPKGDYVKTVNGNKPDASGNVVVASSGNGSGQNVELDTTLTQSGKAADAKAVGDKIAEITGISLVEPAEDDIPKVFFEGDITGMSKDVSKDLAISYRSKTLSFDGTVEMKWQGSSSIRWPKKNFTIKMFTDSAKGEKLKKDFRGWGAQNKFCLKANYVDHSHARNVVSAKLWDEVVNSRPDYDSLPEEMRNSPSNGAVDGFPIKVYINGTYEGVYTWNIPKDGWMFNMTEDNPNHCVLCGANNSFNGRPTPTSCQFRIPYNSSDWKTEFPDVLTQDMIDKFNRVVTFMTTSTDDEFKAHLGEYVDVQSAIDYRIFADVIAHHDGLGNNMIFLTYDGVVWLFSMYDMDSTFGLWWDGTKFVAVDLAFPSEFQEPENLMWERLDKCFANEIKERYSELRKSVLSLANMDTHFERFMDVIGSDLYAEDLTIYTGIPSGSTNNIKQIRNYIRDRLAYVDGEIAALGEEPDEPDEPNEPVTAGLLHSFEGANATSTEWVDSVDPSYQFNFTGSPTVENGIVKFSASSYGVLNKNLGISGKDVTLVARCAIDTAKAETWVVGTPNWVSGFIIGKKNKSGNILFHIESGMAVPAYFSSTFNGAPDGAMHNYAIKYVHSENNAYCYVDGLLIGTFTNAKIGSWISGIINLNNENENLRAANSVEYLKIYDGALNDDEIGVVKTTVESTFSTESQPNKE